MIKTKNKYIDNRLAEELDVIVLKTQAFAHEGLPRGSLGALTYSYTGRGRPLYGRFEIGDTAKEIPLHLNDFRVLNAENKRDLPKLAAYYNQKAI